MIEVWSLPTMHGGIAQRLEPRQWLAGESADLYRLSVLSRFYSKRAKPTQKGDTKQKAWK